MRPAPTIQSWTILVVDDEPDSIEVASDVLRFHGATVYSASNGQKAIEKLDSMMSRPTFVLTDLSMPEMDGWALLSEIRKRPHFAGMPVVALTAHAMKGDAERALAAGFTAYLTKPLSPFSLIEDIMEQLPALA